MRRIFISLLFCGLSLITAKVFAQGKLVPKFSEAEEKYGYVYEYDTSEFKIAPQFISAYPFIENYGRVQTEAGFFLINSKGNPINEEPFEQIGWSDDEANALYSYFYFNHIGFKKDGKWGLINKEGEIIVKPSYDSIHYFIRKLAPVAQYDSLTKKYNFGAINLTGKEIIPFIYNSIRPIYGSSNVLVEKSIGNQYFYGVLTQNGKEVLGCSYPKIESLKNGLYAVKSQNGLWGIFNEKGKQLQKFEFEKINSPNNFGHILAQKDGLWGIFNKDISINQPFIHKSISITDSSYFYQKATQFEIINNEGQIQYTLHADSIINIYPNLYRYHINEKVGVWNSKDNQIIFQGYDWIDTYWSHGHSLVKKGENKGIINQDGKIILQPIFKDIFLEKNNIYRVCYFDGTFDLYDFQGQNLTNHKYSIISSLSSELFLAKKGTRFGYLDTNLKVTIPFIYKNAEPFIGKHAVAKRDDYYGVINKQQDWIISPVVDYMQSISEDLYLIRDQGIWETLDINGIELFRSNGETYKIREDGSVLLKYANQYGLLNDKGEFCLPVVYDKISLIKEDETVSMSRDGVDYFMNIYESKIPLPGCYDFADRIDTHHEQYAVIQKGDFFGFVDYLGRLRISLRYDDAKHFSEGIAPVKINHRWGYLNKEDRFEIQPNWEEASSFSNGTAIVKLNGKFGVIKRDGSLLIPYKYDKIKASPKGNWLIEKAGKVGILSYTGDQSIYEKYDDIIDLGNGYIFSILDGKYGLDKIDGYSILFPTKDELRYNFYDNTYQIVTYYNKEEVKISN
ncbi:WG repeat-containing protein [Sediminitomix flava]|uniref:WG repeat protein n=1 Tax=Sediminitomix flava TaxID=379075 RepID=A0A315ZX14_SEDFL|nr:WG repeat-containing protein [Sediminitomix flava]PWJ41867.1 WG repeat protein [Sediminitomix flava]